MSLFIGNSKFGMIILFDGRGHGVKIFMTVSYVYWLQCVFIKKNGEAKGLREFFS